ncbi:Indole-3-pyruvate decarboxylase [Symmachiella macrocystis]|uniref:Indole-3-pyruvate decarboxylase n=1 Tax=Symmachiella macrocystis TaxID=2527985 RepID=A0A5C6B8R7_9PLAN|nr:thiamine pyrophosphate-binding protein [Symmachiella macrocystis]TWU08665.1 Indole-3-pyruvate decarboxylase [Symmachiella macrocystis]
MSTKPRKNADNESLPTIGGYLIRRLQDYGLKHIFGIPGDFVLQFYNLLEESPIEVIGATREDCAGFAADAYARVNGLGAVCVTYCVGGLSTCNSVAGAYAEKSPLIVISGAPGMEERVSDPLLHHRVKDFNTQHEVFDKITIASATLEDPLTAFREIDRCLAAAVRYKRPVYLELPRDRVQTQALFPHEPQEDKLSSHKQALTEALAEAERMINGCKRPVIIAGVEMHRFGLQQEVVKLAEKNKIPMCATLLGKSVVSETHPLYLGIYEGAMGRDGVRKFVEDSDCVILLGTFMTDINLGIYTAHIDPGQCIYITSEGLRIRHHHYRDVQLKDFVKGLVKTDLKPPKREIPDSVRPVAKKFELQPENKVTQQRLFARINELLDDNMVVVADIGDSLFGASDLTIYRRSEFLSPAYYTSMGFAVPAALGVQCANRKLRPLVIVGDGAFQMTCLELSTTLKHGFNPIVLVLNNKGYGTERFLHEGPFNDIPNWAYHRMPDLLGGGWGFEVHTEGDLDKALHAALANKDAFSLLNIHLEKTDVSPALTRLAERLSKRI